jgi:hypothetical protein
MYSGTDGYNNILDFMKDSLGSFSIIDPVFYLDLRDSAAKGKQLVGDLKYAYCSMEYEDQQNTKAERLLPCRFEILLPGRKVFLGCCWLTVVVHGIRRKR